MFYYRQTSGLLTMRLKYEMFHNLTSLGSPMRSYKNYTIILGSLKFHIIEIINGMIVEDLFEVAETKIGWTSSVNSGSAPLVTNE